ncbi:Uncharacterised protein [Salmonella enterica subsp. enterica serovar Bovismorbificans]|nr:Uncharacterised protein [Salmonella enterica subsp. enterica serovar Bovismorbificans]
MGRRDAKSGITLNIKNIIVLTKRANLRKQIRATGHRSAPGKIDFNVFQIRKDLRQQSAVPGSKIVRGIFKKPCGAAKQQTVFFCETVVIYHRADITKSPAQGTDPLNKLAGERFCRDLIRISNQRFLINFWFQIIEKTITGPQQFGRFYAAHRSTYPHSFTVTDLNHR